MPTALIGAGIGAVGSIVGGVLGSSAAKKAGAVQQQTAQQVAGMDTTAATNAQKGIGEALGNANTTLGSASTLASGLYGGETSNLNPYLAAGTQGVNSLAGALAPGGSLTPTFSAPTAAQAEATPGYQFTLQQGLQALNRSQAASGGVDNGNTLSALMKYGQGLASTNYQQTYNNAFQQFQTNHNNTLQSLLALTGVGQNATGQYNQATQQYGGLNTAIAGQQSGNDLNAAQYSGNAGLQGATLAGQALTGGANAQAAGIMGSANAWSGALGGVSNAAQFYNLSQAQKPTSSMGEFQGPPDVFGAGGGL